jgi:hypothetical protein
MAANEAGFQISVETLLSATCDRQTLLVRCDRLRKQASLAIDEGDNGTIVSLTGPDEILDALCKALHRPAIIEPDELRVTNIFRGPEGAATLSESSSDYVLRLDVISERERSLRFSHADGKLLCKAIRGSFGFWD